MPTIEIHCYNTSIIGDDYIINCSINISIMSYVILFPNAVSDSFVSLLSAFPKY